eukprot:757725-Hanusia_phi.AAC.6
MINRTSLASWAETIGTRRNVGVRDPLQEILCVVAIIPAAAMTGRSGASFPDPLSFSLLPLPLLCSHRLCLGIPSLICVIFMAPPACMPAHPPRLLLKSSRAWIWGGILESLLQWIACFH